MRAYNSHRELSVSNDETENQDVSELKRFSSKGEESDLRKK